MSNINDNLHQTQGRLANLISQQEDTEQGLQTRTLERDEVRQAAQLLKENLEVSQLKENELNEQITRLKSEITEVNKKIKEVKIDRKGNHSAILNYHQEEIQKLKKERDELLKNHQTLTTLYEKNNQQLAKSSN